MNDFFRILFQTEFKALSGRSKRTIVALVSILLFTILALGLAYGTLQNLKERMDNPYTNWVDVPVTVSIEPKVDDILNHFRRSENLDEFKLADVTRYDVYYAQFLHQNMSDTFYQRGRTVEADERILKSILKDIKGNVIVQHSTMEESPCGIIVTDDFLASLGYRGNVKDVLKISMPYNEYRVLIDIIAVVKELPSLCDFISGPVLPNMRNLSSLETGFIDETINNVIPVVIDHKLTDNELKEIESELTGINLKKITEREQLSILKGSEQIVYDFVFTFGFIPDVKVLNEILQNGKAGKTAFLYKEVNCNEKFNSVSSPDNFAFQFNDLDNIRNFKDGMLKRFDINVSMQQVESAENFSLVSTLTLTTSLVLFAFALLSIGFYISSLIRSHLQKISANLGTMKAFGLENSLLTKVYIAIIGIFCLASSLISLIIAVGIQGVVHKMELKIDLDVLNIRVIMALIIIVLLCLYLAFRNARQILGHTPGDLIYKRNA